MASLEIGQSYRSSIAVTDSTGALVAPATKVLTVKLPDQTTVTPAVQTLTLGNYYVDYVFTQEGLHAFSWLTTSPFISETDYQNVNTFRSVIGLNEAKDYINFGNSSNETILRQLMAATTEMIENVVGTTVQRLITDEYIPGNTKAAIRVPQAPVPTVNAVTQIKSIWAGGPIWTQAAGDFVVSPDSGVVYLKNLIPFYFGPWLATYTAGRLVIPQAIQLAAKEIIFDMWANQRPYGADELEPGPETTARIEQMIATYSVPAHANELLNAHAIPGFA
jgi:hypothetical protein